MRTDFDVIVVGGGPAGASCAAVCAAAGIRVLVLERAVFPRDKVCGDCLNPDCWPVLARLGVAEGVRRLPHADLGAVEFVSASGRKVSLSFPMLPGDGEIAVKRSALDALLLQNASDRGATVRYGVAAGGVKPNDDPAGFVVESLSGTGAETLTSRFLVAADGRNSVVARSLALMPENRPGLPNRIGVQTHIPCPPGFTNQVQMRWFPEGYGGLAPVGGNELNISLTGPPRTLDTLKRWARDHFDLPPEQVWRTIAPLDRRPAPSSARESGVFLVGDAARVVEPFTGEGIYYALRSGELAAQALIQAARGEWTAAQAAAEYRRTHGQMYQGRLWVNRLARAAGLHPRMAGWVLELARWRPELLGYLTRKVVRASVV